VDWKDTAGYTLPTTDGDYKLNGSAGVDAGDNSLYPANAAAIQALLLSGVTLSAEAMAAINAAPAKDAGAGLSPLTAQ
jgi:hypothetical protein